MAGGGQELRKKFDTAKMSAEELKMCATDDARRVVGKAGMQPGGVSWRHSRVLAGVAVLTGISTAMYYNSVNHVQEGEAGNSNDLAAGDSAPVADAPADAAAA